jgi:hypothetical protein
MMNFRYANRLRNNSEWPDQTHVDSFIGARKQMLEKELSSKLEKKMNVKLGANG